MSRMQNSLSCSLPYLSQECLRVALGHPGSPTPTPQPRRNRLKTPGGYQNYKTSLGGKRRRRMHGGPRRALPASRHARWQVQANGPRSIMLAAETAGASVARDTTCDRRCILPGFEQRHILRGAARDVVLTSAVPPARRTAAGPQYAAMVAASDRRDGKHPATFSVQADFTARVARGLSS